MIREMDGWIDGWMDGWMDAVIA